MTRMTNWELRILILLVSAVFLVLTIPNITIPPINPEEIDGSLWAMYILEPSSETAQRFQPCSISGIYLMGRYFPFVEDGSFYVGAVEHYLQLPLFYFLGPNPFSLRLLPILFSLAGLMAVFALCRSWFGIRVATFTVFLAATHPVFVHFSRQGHYTEEVFTAAFFWVGLYFCNRFFEGGPKLWKSLVFGSFLFGLGLSHKITFLWFILGIIAAWFLLRRNLSPVMKKMNRKLFAASAAAFTSGSSLILLANLESGGKTLKLMAGSLMSPTPKDSINNLHYLHNLSSRFSQFVDVILEGELWDPMWFSILNGSSFIQNHFFAALFLAGYFTVLLFALKNRTSFPRTKVFGLYIVFTTVFLCSPFTVSTLRPSHLLVLHPFPQIVVSLFLCSLPDVMKKKKPLIISANIAFVCLFAINLYLTVSYQQAAEAQTRWKESPFRKYELREFLGAKSPESSIIPMPERW